MHWVRACPDCGRGSHGHAGVPGTSRDSGDDVLRRLGVKRGALGAQFLPCLRGPGVAVAKARGAGRGGVRGCPPRGTRIPLEEAVPPTMWGLRPRGTCPKTLWSRRG